MSERPEYVQRWATADKRHPAQWSPEVLGAIAPILTELDLPVHDPFAGTGVRLGWLCDQLGLKFSGTEIEPEFIVDERVQLGDSTTALSYPTYEHVIVTSPAYPNGMADHFRSQDGSRRHTYRQALADIIGRDRELHENNMGRYGVRSGYRALARHMDIAERALRWWLPNRVILNVSDFIRNGKIFPLVGIWLELLQVHGYTIADVLPVKTPRNGHGANRELRVEHETVILAVM